MTLGLLLKSLARRFRRLPQGQKPSQGAAYEQAPTQTPSIHKRSDLIFDVGMHDGQDTDYYLQKGFQVVSIEADPQLCAGAAERFKSYIADKKLQIVNMAIADDDGDIDFFVNKHNSKWSSAIETAGSRGDKGFTKITVKGTQLNKLMEQYGVPYFCKIDIEGHDFMAIKSLSLLPQDTLPDYMSVEGGSPAILKYLHDLGYNKFAFVNQQITRFIECPNPPKEGVYVNHEFPHGASGMFGKEIAEEWQDLEGAIATRGGINESVRIIKEEYADDIVGWRRERNKIGWWDVHATK